MKADIEGVGLEGGPALGRAGGTAVAVDFEGTRLWELVLEFELKGAEFLLMVSGRIRSDREGSDLRSSGSGWNFEPGFRPIFIGMPNRPGVLRGIRVFCFLWSILGQYKSQQTPQKNQEKHKLHRDRARE